MRTWIKGVVGHPVAVTMCVMAALTFGLVSLGRLPTALMPDIGYPTITVRTEFPGAAPQEVETQISERVEESLATLDGLVSMESRSRAESSDVVLHFGWQTDLSESTQAIREALQSVWLPVGSGRPLILRYDPSLEPIMRLALSVDADADEAPTLLELRRTADREVKRALEGVPGVAAVRVQGGLEREIRIEVREDWLAARQVTIDQVRQALTSENINIAGGSVVDGDVEYLVRTVNQFATVDEIRDLQIRRTDGVRVPLVDVAQVVDGVRDRQVVSRMNGGEAIQLDVFKEADANIVSVANRLKADVKAWRDPEAQPAILPRGTTLTLMDDQAAFIEAAVSNLRNTATVGGLLAVGVLFFFLRDLRATAIIGLAIPLSIVVGFAPLFLLGVTLNLMSLGGLALGVGMLVDNAIVVLESIHRFREDGASRTDAAVEGTAEVAAAVIASTLTTISVFVPLAFVEGVAGRLFGDLAVAVIASVSASMFVALLVVPMLAALDPTVDAQSDGSPLVETAFEGPSRWSWAWDDVRQEWRAWREQDSRLRRVLWLPWAVTRLLVFGVFRLVGVGTLTAITWIAVRMRRYPTSVVRGVLGGAYRLADRFGATVQAVARAYGGLIPVVLARARHVTATAAVMLGVALVWGSQLGRELIPEVDQGRFSVELTHNVGTPLERTTRTVEHAEALLADIAGIRSVYAVAGFDPRVQSPKQRGEHTAELRLELDGGLASSSSTRVQERVREALSQLDHVDARIERPSVFSYRTPVEVVVTAWDLEELAVAGASATERMSALSELVDVRNSLTEGHPEVQIAYDRARLHQLGLDPAGVAQHVRDKVLGVDATLLRDQDERVEMRVQLVEPDRRSLTDLADVNINPNLRPALPLRAVAELREGVGPSEIRRVDQRRAVVVGAQLADFDLAAAVTSIERALRGLPLPAGSTWSVEGQATEMDEGLASLRFAFGLAVFLVYVILASMFESVVRPLLILVSVPLAGVGAVVALGLTGQTLNVVVGIGLIVLAGIVVNNAIVWVDAVGRRQAEGHALAEAIQAASRLRFRPILITTTTTVLGLLPLALGFGAGAEIQSPLALTVIGGLLSSTGLTLLFLPALVWLVQSRR